MKEVNTETKYSAGFLLPNLVELVFSDHWERNEFTKSISKEDKPS